MTDSPPNELSWRIPGAEQGDSLHMRVIQICFLAMLLTVVVALAPRTLLAPCLLAVIGISFVLYWRARRAERALRQPNIRLDDRGVHWRETPRRWNSFTREHILGFRISLDADTERTVAALTLLLVGGFESQPLEIHSPATVSSVRDFLNHQWNLLEPNTNAPPDPRQLQAACDRPPPSFEKRLLANCQIAPEKKVEPWWCVFRGASIGEIDYDPTTCRFRWKDTEQKKIETFDFAELASDMRRRVFEITQDKRKELAHSLSALLAENASTKAADDANDAQSTQITPFVQWLAEELVGDVELPLLSAQIELHRAPGEGVAFEAEIHDSKDTWRIWGQSMEHVYAISDRQLVQGRQELLAAATRVGFLAQFDEDRCDWRFTGTKSRLLTLCDELEQAADELSAVAPPGAKPLQKNLGDGDMRFLVHRASQLWMTAESLAGPPDLLQDLARCSRSGLAETTDTKVEIVAPPSSAVPWRLTWKVCGEGHSFAESDLLESMDTDR